MKWLGALAAVITLAAGCGDDSAATDAGADGGVPVDGPTPADAPLPVDGSIPPLPVGEIPGGAPGTAPIVGCEDADRPARRLASAAESCEALGGARCWFVDPDGDDAGDATFAAPYRTPQEAVRQAGAGDVIYLRGGVYDDSHAHDAGARVWDDSTQGTYRGIVSIAHVSLPGWAGGANYMVASGTESAPIVVKSFPGERACVDGAGSIRIGSISQETAHWRVEDITLRRGFVLIGGGSGGGTSFENQTRDIHVRRMEISHGEGNERDNTGLVRVDRGDWGGPAEILIESNILHDLSVIDEMGVRHPPTDGHDAQHFGSVTMLSCETYVDPACGGTGEIVIRNNHVYEVPSAFFLKNPALGPFVISGNVIHDVAYMGNWAPANVTFEDNVVYRSGGGIAHGDFGGSTANEVWLRSGRNLVLRNNTFIGFDGLVTFRIWASGHTIRGNVIEGLTLSLADESWDNMGAIVEDHAWVNPDTATDIADSRLAMDNDFDDNCFVTNVPDFIAYGRRNEVTTDNWVLDHLSLDEARSTLGHELGSDRADDPATVFADFAAGDYAVSASGPCAGRGAAVPPWATATP